MSSDLDDFLPSWAVKLKPPESTPQVEGKKPTQKAPPAASHPTPPSEKPGQKPPFRKVEMRLPEEVRTRTHKINNSKFGFNKRTVTLEQGLAVGMAKGTITQFNPKKAKGLIKIGDTEHAFEDNRHKTIQKAAPLNKLLDQEISFTFYPTLTQKSAPHLKATDPVRLKIAALRKTLPFPNAVEVMGMINRLREGYFVVSFFSDRVKKVYQINIHGECPGQLGDVIFIRAILDKGLIQYKKHHMLYAREKESTPDQAPPSGAPPIAKN